MNTQELVFLKQLVDNVEFANDSGVLNVLKLFKHEDPDVRNGTSFAVGAFDTLQRLIDLLSRNYEDCGWPGVDVRELG